MRSASGIPELRARITHLEAEIERLTLDGVHTCHERCQRIACVQRREIERLRTRLSALSTAAYDYAGNYLLDERDDPDLCAMFPNQHERIVALFDAIEEANASLSSSGEG